MSINSFFTEPQAKQPDSREEKRKSTTVRKIRSDKRHNVKFPITPVEHQLLRMTFKQASESVETKKKLTQTHFNTNLLKFALSNLEIVDWGKSYKDSKRYLHVQPLESDYGEIGGPYGLSTQKQMSDRKVVYYLVISALDWLRREGNYEKILQ